MYNKKYINHCSDTLLVQFGDKVENPAALKRSIEGKDRFWSDSRLKDEMVNYLRDMLGMLDPDDVIRTLNLFYSKYMITEGYKSISFKGRMRHYNLIKLYN